MTAPLGIVMLVHTALNRAGQVARHWARAGCPVVIHVDRNVPRAAYQNFVRSLSDTPHIEFSRRHRCEWGTWGIVAATQDAAEQVLRRYPEVRHVYLTSGSCLPLRPVQDLIDYLAARPRTDFIESATTADVPWTVGGLDAERFTLRFPFSWRKHRALFDGYVRLQRRLGVKRRVPKGLVPHMGSQWWCLTRQTLTAILENPDRVGIDRYFRKVWIPDESYFQTLARQWSTHIESRSLTLSKFDFQGKPHIFYDDHMQLLRRSDCFVARKIWPHAEGLYRAFLTDAAGAMKRTEPNPGKIDRLFAKAVERRTQGRPGLYSQSRFPKIADRGLTAARYSVFQGFDELFHDFRPWLEQVSGARVHGHLFAPDRVQFAEDAPFMKGALSDAATLRDANPAAFLANLVWNTRGERQCFQLSPKDRQAIAPRIARDPQAEVAVISGAWAVPLFRANGNFAEIRAEAARLQKVETKLLTLLRTPQCKARVRIWTMAEFVEAPMEPLQAIVEDIGRVRRMTAAPRMVDLQGFGRFLQNLKNQGMHPYLTGDFPVDPAPSHSDADAPKPYLVKK
ncbi:beta-1,6-N-acetylglucosaminyltransferase [Mesobacterium sp. TK19101]|uniref:Peptide O-xylosyltransferase n=1 Tax=Mesobacterium hydrothermale TaxID=3111907 RepID=A0ABU6HFP5_9RHOB|nr:beta-1,6-N-acetylglucosaminyltransferase [Mesobacterium sp. TK19101]MEC3860665.1 beta-1,6-N-acetylglucosaminyltransferase [Mesobacterium sp. TK19101]